MPDSRALSPFPGSARKSVTGSGFRPRLSASRSTAFARGCSLSASREAAQRSSSASSIPAALTSFVTAGSPRVMVPVLSSATMSALPVSSREAEVLNSTPFRAPMPLPTMIATGVARPKAQGQEITSTEMPRESA